MLNYTVTSNHIHILVRDNGERDVISNSMQLIAGRTGQEGTTMGTSVLTVLYSIYRCIALKQTRWTILVSYKWQLIKRVMLRKNQRPSVPRTVEDVVARVA